MKKFTAMWKRILTVPNTFDPDDLRRRQVMNAVLLFLLFVLISHVILPLLNKDLVLRASKEWHVEDYLYIWGLISTCLFSTLLLILNRSSRTPASLVGWIFVVGILAIVSVADIPLELTDGRSIFVWAVPVTLSVVVLPPASVFVVDLLITILFSYYSGFQWSGFQSFTLIQIYVVSFISWLGMTIAERAIRDARNELRKNAAILEGVAEGVIVLGPDNQIVLANRAASDLLGTGLTRIIPMAESAEISGRSLALRWSEVEGVGCVAIVRDVSRQIEIDHAKDAILRVVSHEMRTPLAAIMGFAEILETRSAPDMAARIRINAQRMLKLVNDLLEVAQLQAGALTMHNTIFSPSSLAAYVSENFSSVADEKGVVMNVDVAPTLPKQAAGDVQRLEQVVSNLVGNALKFTDKGGRVDIFFGSGKPNEWQIVVKDTGIGIPPERLLDIFEPFRRSSDYASRKHQGIGLGLSIVKKIVQLSGGTVSVESVIGVGSTFVVSLPTEASNLMNSTV